jgi:hypothetical protein
MKTHTTKDETKDPSATLTDMADTLRRNFEESFRAGVKMQEEAARWWTSVLNPATCAQQWQEQFNCFTRTANSVIPLAQKPVSEIIDLAQKNSRSSVDLTKKLADALQAPTPGESQAKWAEWWNSVVAGMSSSNQELSQISAKAMNSWAGFVRDHSKSV